MCIDWSHTFRGIIIASSLVHRYMALCIPFTQHFSLLPTSRLCTRPDSATVTQPSAVGYENILREKRVQRTSWKSCDISHTRQEFDCISHLCRSERKKSRSSGVCVRAWTMQFMKHVLPRFINPRKPAGQEEVKRKHEETRERGTNHQVHTRQREFKWTLRTLNCPGRLTGFLAEVNLNF